jgi:ribonuclease G
VQRAIYIDSVPGEDRVALVEDGLLAEVLVERRGTRGVAGDIYLGRVRTLVPGLQAAFVDLGLDRDGFLPIEDAVEPAPPAAVESPEEPPRSAGPGTARAQGPRIQDCLREGQEILVQVVKEPMGQKGARVTARLALPGHFLVFLPGVDHIGVSRRIGDPGERERLRALVAGLAALLRAPGGFIVRTTGSARSTESFLPDARALLDSWQKIRARREDAAAPVLLHEEAGAIERALRDWLDEEVREVVVDGPDRLVEAIGLVGRLHPGLASRVRAHHGSRPLFEERGLESEIGRALRPRVWLKSGGFIVINQTEALVAIDVNTGKYVGRDVHEETIVRTNLEAVGEIARQLRLRDIGGLIVIDFIDMQDPASRLALLAALEEELRKDRARSRMLPISEFGLVEITRQRARPGIEGLLCRPCPACGGAGRTKSVDTIGFEIVRELRRRRPSIGTGGVLVRVHPDSGGGLRERSASLAVSAGLPEDGLVLEDDPGLRPDQWVLRVG